MIISGFTALIEKVIDMEALKATADRLEAPSREGFFKELYEKAFPPFVHFASRRNASFQDAKDIFHDALVIYYEKTQKTGLEEIGSPAAYVVGIAKHLWIRKFNRDRGHIALSDAEAAISIPGDFFPSVDEKRLLRFLERAGKKCMELLQRFYYDKMPLKDIASALGYRSQHSATVQKFKCVGKVRDAIRSKAMGYEDFLF